MSLVNKPYTFSAGATIVAAEHNSNFDTIFNEFNGSITNANISGSAAITDSKLAQLTTAGKVSGAALTLLGSIPSGAGVVPIANLATGTPDGTKFIRDDGTLQLPAVTSATQAQMEAATSTTVSTTPGNQQYHPSSAKAWCSFNGTGTPAMNGTPYNFSTSITDNGQGNWTLTFSTNLSSANYCVVATCNDVSNSSINITCTAKSTSQITLKARQTDNQATVDPTWVDVVVYGDL